MPVFFAAPLALVPTGLLRWFDAAPARYWTLAWLAWGALVLLTLGRLLADWAPAASATRRIPRWLLHPASFGLMTFVAILAFRWPMLFAGPQQVPDETQLGAGALTYWHDPVPWRSVDLHTSGPLNSYALWPAMLLNGGVDYAGMRFTALLAHVLAALACVGLLRRFTSPGVAQLAVLPLISFLAFCTLVDFVQYSSEQLSMCLLAVAAGLLAVAGTLDTPRESPRRWRLALAGICLGCLPFAKMQGAPLGLALGVFGLIATWFAPAPRWQTAATRVLILIAGALLPAAVTAVTLTIYGLWAQFYAAYFLANTTYLSGYDEARARMLRDFIGVFVDQTAGFGPYFWSMVGMAAVAALSSGLLRLRPRLLLAGAWVLAAIGLWTVTYPGRPFGHYLHFILVPLTFLGGLSLVAVLRESETAVRTPRRARWWIVGGFAALSLLPQVVSRARVLHPEVGSLVQDRLNSVHPVSARLRALARPGDTLFVWGWFSRLYIESGLPQGTREAQTDPVMDLRPMRPFYRQRLMRDLRKNQPAFIVDAVCPGSFGYVDRQIAGLQTFPELADYVAKNYRLLEEREGYRIYVRR